MKRSSRWLDPRLMALVWLGAVMGCLHPPLAWNTARPRATPISLEQALAPGRQLGVAPVPHDMLTAPANALTVQPIAGMQSAAGGGALASQADPSVGPLTRRLGRRLGDVPGPGRVASRIGQAIKEPKIVVVHEPTYRSRFPEFFAVPTSPIGADRPFPTPGLTVPAEAWESYLPLTEPVSSHP